MKRCWCWWWHNRAVLRRINQETRLLSNIKINRYVLLAGQQIALSDAQSQSAKSLHWILNLNIILAATQLATRILRNMITKHNKRKIYVWRKPPEVKLDMNERERRVDEINISRFLFSTKLNDSIWFNGLATAMEIYTRSQRGTSQQQCDSEA